ncbi:general transcription factor IIIA, b [Betta splendens]|uniref:Transcription factor IIIA n=1 Tax=Betta splendens TaxID=158456 RepID=A0A6P7MDX9_BETSP|nr:general transcription factor IIIA, b [Betta splendens]
MGERLQSQKSYVCSFFDCKAIFSKSWKLEAHLCKHTGLKPFSCENCDKSFCTRYQLTRHELSHSGEKPHKCLVDGCSEAFITNASMRNHMARVHHHQEKLYQCDHQGCGKPFRKRNQLKAHQHDKHQLPSFQCSVGNCLKAFPSRRKLKHHEKVHKGYTCGANACPFLGKTWTEYLKHRKEHKEKLPCEQCRKRFSNSWFLHLHKLHVHSGERRMFSCPKDGCEKKFTRRFNLDSHVLGDHEGKKPFRCAHAGCGRSFAMKESLWRHGVVHDPARKKLTKLHPKKQQPQRRARQVSAVAVQVDTSRLAAKLEKTTLN